MLVGEREHLLGRLDGVERAGGEGRADLLGDVTRRDLVAERADRVRRRTDPDEARVDDRLREVGVLGEESVAGVDGVRSRAPRDGEELRGDEVRLGARRAFERVGLVGELDVPGVAVLVGVDGDRRDAGVARGADDADRDFAAVGDEHLRDPSHGSTRLSTGGHPELEATHKNHDPSLSVATTGPR